MSPQAKEASVHEPTGNRTEDVLICLSLAGLMLLSAGDRILSLPIKYLRWAHAGQLLLGIVTWTLILWLLKWAGRGRTALGQTARGLFLLLPLYWLPDALTSIEGVTTAYLALMSGLGRFGMGLVASRTLVLLLVLGGLSLLVYLALRTRARRWMRAGLLLLAALPALLVGQVLLRLTLRPAAPPPASQIASHRVIWLVFDELDQPILADHLESLPAFRALASQSLVATQAHAPSNYTDLSLPSLWTGTPIFDASSSSRGGLLIRATAQAPWSRTWLKGRTVFEHVHALGQGVHIVGWHLPYCALFPDGPGFTTEDTSPFAAPGPGQNIFAWMLRDSLIWNQVYALNARRYRHDLDRYEAALENQPKGHLGRRIRNLVDAQEAALENATKDATAALVFGHLGAPHLPLSGTRPSGLAGPQEDYLANLKRCDRFIAATILPLLQEPSTPTLVIISSDHWFRYAEAKSRNRAESTDPPRRPIPFLVFMSGGQQPPLVPYERGFNTERTRDLVEAFLQGRVQTYPEARALMDTWPDTATRLVTR